MTHRAAPWVGPFASRETGATNCGATPAELVTAIVTERGVVRAPHGERLRQLATAQ